MKFGYLPQSGLETGNLRTDDQLRDAIKNLQVSSRYFNPLDEILSLSLPLVGRISETLIVTDRVSKKKTHDGWHNTVCLLKITIIPCISCLSLLNHRVVMDRAQHPKNLHSCKIHRLFLCVDLRHEYRKLLSFKENFLRV